MRTRDQMNADEIALTKRSIDAGKPNGEALAIEDLSDAEWRLLRKLVQLGDLDLVPAGGDDRTVYVHPTATVPQLMALAWFDPLEAAAEQAKAQTAHLSEEELADLIREARHGIERGLRDIQRHRTIPHEVVSAQARAITNGYNVQQQADGTYAVFFGNGFQRGGFKTLGDAMAWARDRADEEEKAR